MSYLPTAIDLFAGGGGVTRGLINAGFDVVASYERDEKIAKVHADNFGDRVIVGDAMEADYRKHLGIFHLHASPPCQEYSLARSKSLPAHEGKDAGLAVIKAVRECRPLTVSIENVDGYRKAPIYHEICNELRSMGYWVVDRVVNFAAYGVPQNRRRLIMLASRVGIPQFPYENPRFNGWYSAVSDLLPGCPDTTLAPWQIDRLKHYNFDCLINEDGRRSTGVPADRPSPTVTTTGSGSRFKAVLVRNFSSDLTPTDRPAPTLRADKQGAIRVLLPRDGANQKTMKPITETDPAPVIRAGGTEGDRHSHLFDVTDGIIVKKLDIRCLARLQTFPNNYRFPKQLGLSTKILGNSVPPLAAEVIGRSILSSILANVA